MRLKLHGSFVILALLVFAPMACDLEGPDPALAQINAQNDGPVEFENPYVKPEATPAKTTKKLDPIHETYVHAPTRFVPGARSAIRVLVRKATDMTTTVPMAHAEVKVALLDTQGKKIAHLMSARTNGDGTISRSVRFPQVKEGSYQLAVNTQSKHGKSELKQNITVTSSTRIMLVTDKPIYQPSQTIHLRALALHEFDLTPAAKEDVQLIIEDAKGNRVFKKTMKTGEYGEVYTDFLLANEINEGAWRVKATMGDVEAEKAVQIKKYVLPKFKIKVDAGAKYFKPGDTVKGKVEANYFFGKPVAGGEVTLTASKFDVAFHEFARITGKTDKDGSFSFELALPKVFQGQPLQNGDALLKIDATVRDTAEHTQRSVGSWPVAASSYRVTLIPESGKLVPDVKNRIYAIAATPSGEPLAKTTVTIEAGKQTATGTTDESGIVELEIHPTAADFSGAPYWNGWTWVAPQGRQVNVKMNAVGPGGEKLTKNESMSSEGGGGPTILLRPNKGIYTGGRTAKIDIFTSKVKGAVYLDVVKQGQTIATRTVQIRRGRGQYRMSLSHDFTGTLELHAYVIPMNGNIVRDTKVVYVEPPTDLNVKVTPSKKMFRPGEDAVIKLHVTDAKGRGVSAAVAAVIVDESVYALQEIQPGLEKVYFMLEKELSEPKVELHYQDNNFAELIQPDPERKEARRDRAARILLASASDLYAYDWTVNPAQERVRTVATFYQQVYSGLHSLVQQKGSTAGRVNRRTGAWEWNGDPLPRIRKMGWNHIKAPKDPWGRPVTVQALADLGYPVSYDRIAAQVSGQRLQQVYYGLVNYAGRHPRTVSGRKNAYQSKKPWKFPGDVVNEMLKEKLLHELYAKDAWGNTFVYVETNEDVPTGQRVYGYAQLRRSKIVSKGPDGRLGTKDDIDTPQFWAKSEFWQSELGMNDKDGIVALGALGGGWGGGGRAARGAVMADMGGGGGDFAMMDEVAEAAPVARREMRKGGKKKLDRRPAATKSASVATGNGRDNKNSEAQRQEAAVERVRSYFPETLLWSPGLITDSRGNAELRFPVADSITSWRLTCSANAKNGALGACSSDFKVFQDFFVDINLPVALTRGDEVSIPVAVYNYLEDSQEVRLEFKDAEWFELLSDAEQRVTLKPGQVDVRYFRIRANKVGNKKLEVAAYGPKMSDAVRRGIEIVPDGKKVEIAQSNSLETGELEWSFEIPDGAVADASQAFVKFYPGTFSQVVEGLENVLRMPGGCMEQTGSSAYPNTLVVDYLNRSKQNTPQIRMKAEEYVNLGYQRMLTFQTPSGGFALWGSQDVPKVFLTAWGLQILQDTSKIHDVDERVLSRARNWLAGQQKADGSFPTSTGVHREIWGRFAGEFGMTAYVAWSLAEGDKGGAVQDKALRYLEKNHAKVDDPYLLAMAGAAFAAAKPNQKTTNNILARLAGMRKQDKDTVYWGSEKKQNTFYAGGGTAVIETTALASYALHRGGRDHNIVKQGLQYLIKKKDPNGTWFSTQGTILSLKALLAASDPTGNSGAVADIKIIVNDEQAGAIEIRPENSDVLQMVDLRPYLKNGKNTVNLAITGEANTAYQAVARYYLPWNNLPAVDRPEPFKLDLVYDRKKLDVEDTVMAKVRLELLERRASDNIMLDLGIPPGFTPDAEAFDKLKNAGKIAKYSMTGRQIIVYLDHLNPGEALEFEYGLKAKFPIRAKAPKSTAYKYYAPSEKTESRPVKFVVSKR